MDIRNGSLLNFYYQFILNQLDFLQRNYSINQDFRIKHLPHSHTNNSEPLWKLF